jgi:hypothetical protein
MKDSSPACLQLRATPEHRRLQRCAQICDGWQMAGVRLHLGRRGGATRQRGCGLRCPYAKMPLECRRPDVVAMRLVKGLTSLTPPQLRPRGWVGRTRASATQNRTVVSRNGEEGFRVSRLLHQPTTVAVASPHMALQSPCKLVPCTTGCSLQVRDCAPIAARSRARRWKPASMAKA